MLHEELEGDVLLTENLCPSMQNPVFLVTVSPVTVCFPACETKSCCRMMSVKHVSSALSVWTEPSVIMVWVSEAVVAPAEPSARLLGSGGSVGLGLCLRRRSTDSVTSPPLRGDGVHERASSA